MTKFRNLTYFLISIAIFVILVWFFAIPNSLIQDGIEDSISSSGKAEISASLNGLRKGLFFNVYADSLDLKIDDTPAISITDLSGRFNPLYLIKKQFAFSIKGKIGTGDINGSFRLPEGGDMKIEKAELNAIPYLTYLGIKINGYVSANLNLKDNTMYVIFKIPDLNIDDSAMIMLPLVNSFHRAQGALSIEGDTITVKSMSLEGEKGYARIKGDIINGYTNLTLELMPSAGELKPVESMLIDKYQVSPGYFVIPIKGNLL